jgi:flagellar hook-basal body complex protein FliE
MSMPGLRPMAMPSAPDSAAGKIIPQNELEKLSSSVLQPNRELPPNLSPASGVEPGAGFEGFLGHMVNEVSAKQAEAGASMRSAMTGTMPLHQAMIAVEEASVSFQLMVEVRNKLLESYQELMRMQV